VTAVPRDRAVRAERPAAVQSARRIYAMVLRYLYLLRGSLPRLLDLCYWPTMQMLLWGLLTQFLATKTGFFAEAAGYLLAGVLLWDVMFRGNIGIALSFLEEMWSRNLAQLFASPLRAWEWALSLFVTTLIRTVIGILPAALLAIPLYHFSIFEMGWALVAFFFNLLVFGCAIGLVTSGLVLRWGLGAESLCWAGIFLIQPISGVFYPIAILPDWLIPVALALPSAHVFEGMRAVLVDGVFLTHHLWKAMALNLVYLALSLAAFLAIFRNARRRGALLQMGE
jgi:ABC-2 type transport system permease protein